MKNAKTLKTEKPYRLSRTEYMQWKSDQKSKQAIRALMAMVFDKVKNWEKGQEITL